MSDEVIHECEVDETLQDDSQVPEFIARKVLSKEYSIYQAVIDMRETLALGLYAVVVRRELVNILSLLAYAMECPARRKRTPMDVDAMIAEWKPLLRKLATAHDVDEKDAASSRLDELLLPVVSAPVAQIRSFYRGLISAMKHDPSIPWAVWRLFEFWGSNVLDKLENEQMLTLKKDLATRIAELSMVEIPRDDWIASMVGALMWRNQETLEKVEKAIEAGKKPRVRGKESCLFLQVGRG